MFTKKVIFFCSLSVFALTFLILYIIFSRGEDMVSVCQSEVCRKEAKRILSNLNTSVDPCVDFYQYSCGGWIANNVLDSDESVFNMFKKVENEVEKRLQKMYFQSENKTEIYPMAFIQRLYQSCADNENGSLEEVRFFMDFLGGWPLASGERAVNDWKEMFTRVLAQFGEIFYPGSFFSFSLDPDYTDTLTYRIRLSPPMLEFTRHDFLSNDSESEKIRKAYSEYITNTARLFGAKGDIKEDVEKLIRFETEMAMATSPPEESQGLDYYRSLTFAELRDQVPEVDWFELIVNVYRKAGSSVQPKEEDKIVVSNINYIQQLSFLLKKTETLVIVNYLGWRVIQNLESWSPNKLRDISFNYDRIKYGIQKPVELRRQCLRFLRNQVPDLIGRKYIDAYFTEIDRKKAEKIIEYVSIAFENLIQPKDWFDPETKRKAVEKLRAVTNSVGYPLWLINDTHLESVYNFSREIDPKKTFEGMNYIQKFMTRIIFEKLNRKVDKSREWIARPLYINAVYDAQQNSIIFPAGILQIPYFNSDRPGFLNYGAFGSSVGHELTHGFDDEGSQIDKDGNLFNWWSNDTKRKFDEKAKCFIDQYSSVFIERLNMSLNGEDTVGENIADNGGLREAFDAYHLHYNDRNPDQTLPGLEKYSFDQLFFISFASIWCSLSKDETLRQKLLYNNHSPDEFRVNIPASNFEGFAKAFGCKPGTPMNPSHEKRCILW